MLLQARACLRQAPRTCRRLCEQAQRQTSREVSRAGSNPFGHTATPSCRLSCFWVASDGGLRQTDERSSMASVQLVLFVMSMKAIVVPIVFHVGDVVDELSLAAPPQ